MVYMVFFFFVKQKTAYEMRISDWSSDVCSSDLPASRQRQRERGPMDNVTTLDEIEPITEAPVRDGLSAISIAKSYDKRTVLTAVSVSVGPGEAVGLPGPPAAGTTKCSYSVMGLVTPCSGRGPAVGGYTPVLPLARTP